MLRAGIILEANASQHWGKLPTMKGSREVPTGRMMKCQGHRMMATMMDSQLKTLETPECRRVATASIEWLIEVRGLPRIQKDSSMSPRSADKC